MRRRLALVLAAGLLLAGVPVAVARAAAPQLSVELVQDSDTGTQVGQPATFTAYVSIADENGDTTAAPGWPVEIAATDGSWTAGPVVSDENGAAEFTVTRTQDEVVEVVARVAADGCAPVVSPAIPHSWYDVVLTTSPAGGFGTRVTDTAQVTGTLNRSDLLPARLRPLRFQVFDTGAGSGAAPVIDKTLFTDSTSSATFTWTRNDVGSDAGYVLVSEVLPGGGLGQQVQLAHVWVRQAPPSPSASPSDTGPILTVRNRAAVAEAPTVRPLAAPASPIDITVTVPPIDTRAGEPLVVTAEVSLPEPAPNEGVVAPRLAPGRIALAGVPVVLRTASGATAAGTTDATGVATIPLVNTAVGLQNITATVDALGCQVTGDGGPHTWWQPTLSLDPPTATSDLGTTATATAHLTRDAAPLAGQQLRLVRSMPGQTDQVQTGTTLANGRAVFSWVRTTPGVEQLEAVEVTPPIPVSASAVRIWNEVVTPPPVSPTTPTPTPSTPTPTTPTPSTPTPTTPAREVSEPPEIIDSGSPETTESATTSASGTSTATPPPTSPTPTPTPTLDTGGVGRPGGDVTVSGAGCRPGESVRLSVGRTAFAKTTAAEDGSFSVRHALPDLPPGQYKVTSTCGSVTGQGVIDVSSPETKGGRAGANGATAASFLLFFTLVGNAAVRFVKGRMG